MKHIALLMLLLSLASCNQNGLAVGSAVKNFFMTPVNAVKGIFTDASYKNKREATLDEEGQNDVGEVRYCVDNNGMPIDEKDLSMLDDLSQNVLTSACQCQPWGTCPVAVCPCANLCPQGFDIFRHPAGVTAKTLSTEANGLAFRNGDTVTQHEETQGYCWGHARMTSQFNRLAFFKADTPAPFDLNSGSADEQLKAVEYYKDLIDDIVDNKATDIPGFADLASFSDHPALQSHIGDKVAQGWAKQAMSWQGLFTSIDGQQKSNETYQKLFRDVKERVDMHMQPTIVFTERKSPFMTHALLVSHYEVANDGQVKLCLRDNNYSEANAATCSDHMTIHPTNGLIYNRWGEIGSIKLAHNENADAAAQAESLKKKCQREKGCAQE